MYCAHFEDEIYKCPSCGKFLSNDDFSLSKTWECPDCLEPLYIGVPSIKQTIIRKLPADLKKGDLILLRGVDTAKTVLAVNESTQKGKVYVGIKEYAGINIPEDEYQNVIIGGYFKESWQIK